VNVARNGYLWELERTKDKINFVAGQPFVRHNTFRASIRNRPTRCRSCT
jgi:alcohol dehydrogenase (cytochrome c)